jgi:hypothetical protein
MELNPPLSEASPRMAYAGIQEIHRSLSYCSGFSLTQRMDYRVRKARTCPRKREALESALMASPLMI